MPLGVRYRAAVRIAVVVAGGLVETLQAYLSAGTNLTQSARMLNVHPNTVVYRLRRIRELSGREFLTGCVLGRGSIQHRVAAVGRTRRPALVKRRRGLIRLSHRSREPVSAQMPLD